MKLDNFISFGRPQSGTAVIQLMTELDVSFIKIPKPSIMQSNAQKFSTKNRMSQCTYLKIYNRQ